MIHASEAGHWYDRNGLPVYEVKAKDGSNRPTTLRDARKLGLVPSVTGIIRCADRPGLNYWLQEQVLLAALTLPRLPDEPESAWLSRVRADAQEQSRKAAERGTAIHAAIQGYYEGKYPSKEYEDYAFGAYTVVHDWLDADWTAERSFTHPLGFGGKVDLCCEAAIVDFKTKEFGADDKPETYSEHWMQLAAYRHGLGYHKASCAICYVSANNPGLAKVIEVEEEKLIQGWEMFKGLLSYWQAKNRYYPKWESV